MYEVIDVGKLFYAMGLVSKPRSNTGRNQHDYCHSPTLGGRSPHSSRHWSKPGSSRRSKKALSDSECFILSSDVDDRGGNSAQVSQVECVCGLQNGETCGGNCRHSVQTGIKKVAETCGSMALSAVMMSGGGGMGMKKGSSQRNLSDVDCEQGHTWHSYNDSTGLRSRSVSNSPPSSKCTCDRFKSKETVILNIGGQVFETYKSTLKRLKNCKLSSDSELAKYYREEKGDYFFDRDPYAFSIILNYLRYGDLHLPTNLCGPAVMREFQFWGVDEQEIERCCFQAYNTWKTQTKSLEKLEYDRKQSTTQTDLAHDRNSKNLWRRLRAKVWPFLQDPSSSRAAKVYAWVSIIFVCLSIFSFCAETHPMFKLHPSEVHNLHTLYRIFTLDDSRIVSTSIQNSRKNTSAIPSAAITSGNNGTRNTSGTPTCNTTILASDPDEEEKIQHPALLIIDLACVFFFSLEFLTRLIFCPKKRRFCTSLQNIIDFVAIVPDYVEFVLLTISPSAREGLGFVDFIFILRMLRLCRIFRLIRHVPGLWILLYTLKASFNELMLMFVFLLIGMVMFASLLHFIEGGKVFSNIPVGFWWAVVTMTTVGYGDMVPVTGYGYIIGSICAISGLLMIAFTVPIIVSNFVLYYTHVQYGISDKEFATHSGETYEEIETCSLHTSTTAEFTEDKKSPQEIKTLSVENGKNNSKSTDETSLAVTPVSVKEEDITEEPGSIQLNVTDTNSNKRF